MSELAEFRNEPITDYSKEENRQAMEMAFAEVGRRMGVEYPSIVGGRKVKAEKKFNSINPSNKDEVVGVFQSATPAILDDVMRAALAAFEIWKRVKAEKRAEYLFKAASIMRRRKFELVAWMVLEVGKSWAEADGDVAEAIDFLEFYGREAIRYGGGQPLTPYPGEENELRYIPLGVGAVIPPWNFPMAIMVGMTSASFVAGNTVVLKPSSDAPLQAQKFMEILEEAGLPGGVVNFLPGSGGVVGDPLVLHPKTRFVAFTGSKEVGLRIIELATRAHPGQIWVKRVIAEMGGKDSIIVDDEADIEAAAEGVNASAYGFQGQKCSACSRAIVVEKVYDRFVEALLPKVDKITVGPTRDFGNWMGPVVNKAAYESILGYIEVGKKEGKLLAGGGPAPGNGYFIQPTVIGEIAPMARISQEEIFGPVLALLRAKDFDHAIEIANNTEYGLTGAVYSRNRAKLEKAREEFHVGNLYFNRKCTGALVGVHPFGGFNMSGTDSKAGGRDYLLLLTQAKCISEQI